jgi:hypothetical protein
VHFNSNKRAHSADSVNERAEATRDPIDVHELMGWSGTLARAVLDTDNKRYTQQSELTGQHCLPPIDHTAWPLTNQTAATMSEQMTTVSGMTQLKCHPQKYNALGCLFCPVPFQLVARLVFIT